MNVLQRQPGCDRSAQRPFAVNVVGLEAGAVFFDEEAANLVVFVFHLGPDDGDVGDAAGGDPHLLAVENVLVAHFAGAGAHAAGIGAEAGFGESEAAELFALLHGGQPGLLLLFAAEGMDGIHHQRRLHADEAAHAGVAAFEFLGYQSVLDVAHAGAAIALQRRAEEAEIGHGLDQFAREAAGAVALFDDGDKVVFDELAGGIADQAFFFREERIKLDEIDTAKFDGRHDESPWRANI